MPQKDLTLLTPTAAASWRPTTAPRWRCGGGSADAPVTVVFVHGYCLRMESWHFQRRQLERRWGAAVRMVFYDQRGHGRSGTPSVASCTIGQLGRDLDAVLRSVAPDGPVVLVGHSMGGMTILALARQRPELFGSNG